jgi:hypothetical protein
VIARFFILLAGLSSWVLMRLPLIDLHLDTDSLYVRRAFCYSSLYSDLLFLNLCLYCMYCIHTILYREKGGGGVSL